LRGGRTEPPAPARRRRRARLAPYPAPAGAAAAGLARREAHPRHRDRGLRCGAVYCRAPCGRAVTTNLCEVNPMPEVVVRESAEIAAPPNVVYGIIADYREGHPSILPPRWFTHLHVERGGVGAGTVIRFGMKSDGRVREMRAEGVGPEPGRGRVERARGGL